MRRDGSDGFIIIARPLLISLGLFLSAVFLPPLGMLAPVPLYYALLVHGQKIGLVTIAFCGLAVSSIGGASEAVFFLIFCGLTAWTLAEAYLRRASLEAAIGAATVVPCAAGALVFLIISVSGEVAISEALSELATVALVSVIESYKSAGADQGLIAWVEENSNQLALMFVRIFFGLSIVSVFFTVIINYMVIRVFSIRYGWGIHFPDHSFSGWKTPDHMVWVVIASGFAVFLLDGFAATVGINLLLITGAIYLFQGIAVIHHFFTKSNLSIILRAVGYFLLFSQPPLLIVICGLGFLDVWVDFRKIEKQAP